MSHQMAHQTVQQLACSSEGFGSACLGLMAPTKTSASKPYLTLAAKSISPKRTTEAVLAQKHLFVGRRICEFQTRQFRRLRGKMGEGFWAVCEARIARFRKRPPTFISN